MEVGLLVEELREDSDKSEMTLEDRLFLIQVLHASHHFITKRIERVEKINSNQLLKQHLMQSNEHIQALSKIDLSRISSPEIIDSIKTLIKLFKVLRGKVRSKLESPVRQAISEVAPYALSKAL